jgi:hypothetical protein
MFGNESSSGCSAACSCERSTPAGRSACDRSRSDGSIERESSVIAFSIALSVAIVWPSTDSDAMSEEPDSAGLPAVQRPCARATNAPTWIRSPDGAVSAAIAGRRSTAPMPGTLMTPLPSCGGSCGAGSPGRPGTSGIDRSARPPVALTDCCSTRSAGPVSPVRAKNPVALTGSGVAGRPPPAERAEHAAAPLFAVTGSIGGAVAIVPRSALASHFQGAADAPAGRAAAAASARASSTPKRVGWGRDNVPPRRRQLWETWS